jgi:hypothetical protein
MPVARTWKFQYLCFIINIFLNSAWHERLVALYDILIKQNFVYVIDLLKSRIERKKSRSSCMCHVYCMGDRLMFENISFIFSIHLYMYFIFCFWFDITDCFKECWIQLNLWAIVATLPFTNALLFLAIGLRKKTECHQS